MSDVLNCMDCDTHVQVRRANPGWMYLCKCENTEGTKAAPVPYDGDPASAHDSWHYIND